MKTLHTLKRTLISTLITCLLIANTAFAAGLSEDNLSGQNQPQLQDENIGRTMDLIEKVEHYLRANDTYVGIISRRGAGDPETGVSDTDGFDLTGMAHSGFVIRNGFAKDSEYITFNLVRLKGGRKDGNKKYDISELRVWSLPHFFVGSFEKDAIVFLPEKKVQLKLWNLLRANGALKIEEHKRYLKDKNGVPKKDTAASPAFLVDQVITNGAFPLLHNPEYNLLSDYTEPSSQNCNEHLLLTYIGFRDHWNPLTPGYQIDNVSPQILGEFKTTATTALERDYVPRQMVLSRTKSTFAFVQNIRFGERYAKSPTFFGLKLNKEKFDVVSVDSFCDPENRPLLGWIDFKVFREQHSDTGEWYIEDWKKNYVKVNRYTGLPNKIKEM
ncbi:MAG: hypothetical protein GY702_17915 [Desulfobulbaceae bacterium]|nr:hypothetical protein [Desulfobulbaceae bacterium]